MSKGMWKQRLVLMTILTICTLTMAIVILCNIKNNNIIPIVIVLFLNIIFIEFIFIIYINNKIIDKDISRRIGLPVLISFLSIFIDAFSVVLLLENINLYLLINIIAILLFVLSFILLFRKTFKGKIQNITLEVILIENLDYEREIIYLKDEKNNDLYFIDYDLGDEIRIGEQYKIENLYKSDLVKDNIEFNNKKTKAYYISNINKDEFFKIKEKGKRT